VHAQSRQAFTLIEVLVIITIASILTAVTAPMLQRPSGRTTALQVVAVMQEARLQALGGTSKAVVVTPGQLDASVVVKDRSCDGSVTQRLALPAGLTVHSSLRRGVIWQPDGSGRTCAGSGIYGGTVTVHGRDTWKVVLSSVGRLRMAQAIP